MKTLKKVLFGFACVLILGLFQSGRIEASVRVTDVLLSNSLLVEPNTTEGLVAYIKPYNASNQNVTWKSDNLAVATVSGNGLKATVTGLSKGTANITVTTADGNKTAVCVVRVENKAKLKSISLNMPSITMKATDQPYPVNVTYVRENGGEGIVRTRDDSTNPEVATLEVVSGKMCIVPHKPGTADVTIYHLDGNAKDTCRVTVTGSGSSSGDKTTAKPKSVKVSPAKYTLDVEKKKSVQLTATVSPTNADQTVTWTPSNKNVVTVDKNGLVTAVGRGTATVTATTSNKKKATCRITVTGPIKIKTFKMSKSSATIDLKKKSKTLQLKVNVSPSNASNKTITWKSSNEAVATVKPRGQKATVTGLKGGYTDIIATGENGAKIAKCRITVKEPIKVTGVSLNKSTAEVKAKKPITLKATLTPANPTNKKVKWSSSNTRIATVNSKGKVTGKKPGTVTITVTTDDGKKTATCEVTVKEAAKKK